MRNRTLAVAQVSLPELHPPYLLSNQAITGALMYKLGIAPLTFLPLCVGYAGPRQNVILCARNEHMLLHQRP